MNAWVYVFDEFKPVDIDTDRLFELAEKNPMELFNAIRHILDEYIKDIEDVRVYNVYFNTKTFELLIEYIIRCDLGEISAKLIYSKILERL
jgi:hypothetical protein